MFKSQLPVPVTVTLLGTRAFADDEVPMGSLGQGPQGGVCPYKRGKCGPRDRRTTGNCAKTQEERIDRARRARGHGPGRGEAWRTPPHSCPGSQPCESRGLRWLASGTVRNEFLLLHTHCGPFLGQPQDTGTAPVPLDASVSRHVRRATPL